jgi:hypothetical protein
VYDIGVRLRFAEDDGDQGQAIEGRKILAHDPFGVRASVLGEAWRDGVSVVQPF